MRWKKGEIFRKMPPLAMIQGITVESQKGVWYSGALISRAMYAGMRRDNHRVMPGQFYFFMEFDVNPPGLHIYPTPDKNITVKVRYLPKVKEI